MLGGYRPNLELHLHVKPSHTSQQCTKEVKVANCAKDQLAVEGRKVIIIYEHSAEKCNSRTESIGVYLAAVKVDTISL